MHRYRHIDAHTHTWWMPLVYWRWFKNLSSLSLYICNLPTYIIWYTYIQNWHSKETHNEQFWWFHKQSSWTSSPVVTEYLPATQAKQEDAPEVQEESRNPCEQRREIRKNIRSKETHYKQFWRIVWVNIYKHPYKSTLSRDAWRRRHQTSVHKYR